MPLLFLPAYPITRRNLRLGSGLVLFAYIAAHLANHALGLVSVNVAEVGLRVAVAFWHSLPGTVLLYSAAAFISHWRWSRSTSAARSEFPRLKRCAWHLDSGSRCY